MRYIVRIDDPSKEKLAGYFTALDKRASLGKEPVFVKYLGLGVRIVRVIGYSREFIPHINKQLTYVVREEAEHYDVTLVVWKENELDTLAASVGKEPESWEKNLKLRVQQIVAKRPYIPARADNYLVVFDKGYSLHIPLLDINPWSRIVNAYNPAGNTYYYGVENLEPEEFIKQGHLFVQTLNRILKTPESSLVHAAAVGLHGKGILLCARGQRGKSTLAVRAMLDGFEYIADDYLVLARDQTGLYSWPIYSVVALSPMMYGDLYETLNVKFVSNNGRKDKYMFNIAAYHDRFRTKYPITMAMFPQIVDDDEPSILACTQAGKGRAVTQLIHSTTNQMGDRHDIECIKKLMDFVNDLPFYQINLCRDIEKNLHCLRAFLETGICGEQRNKAGMFSSRAVEHVVFVQQ